MVCPICISSIIVTNLPVISGYIAGVIVGKKLIKK